MNVAVAFGFCVSMCAPPKSSESGEESTQAPGGAYVMLGSVSSTVTFFWASVVGKIRERRESESTTWRSGIMVICGGLTLYRLTSSAWWR